VILVSSIAWDKYNVGAGLPQPSLVHFRDYAKGNFDVINRNFGKLLLHVLEFTFTNFF